MGLASASLTLLNAEPNDFEKTPKTGHKGP